MTNTPNERGAATKQGKRWEYYAGYSGHKSNPVSEPAAPQKELPSCNPTDEDCDVAVDGLLEYLPLSSDGLRQVIACRERELRIALAAKEAAEFECSEYSTVNNWRTQQIVSAKAAGVVFLEPGSTCTNERAELAEKKIEDVVGRLNKDKQMCSKKDCHICQACDELLAILTTSTQEKI